MDNWVLIPCHNNSTLLRSALESVLNQTTPVRIFAVNNGSIDNTPFVLQCLGSEHIVVNSYPQCGVAGAWNAGLRFLFDKERAEKVLVINQDVVLRPDTYEQLDRQNLSFVSAVSTNSRDAIKDAIPVYSRRPHPDFSCFLIRRDCYQTVGAFDENFFPAWFEDNDYHIRAARAGIELCCIDLPFYHYAAGTMKNATEEEKAHYYNPGFLNNKKYFINKWGVEPGTKDYENMCRVNK